jgi:hypothetical protein
LEDLLGKYQTDPHFKAVADAGRHFVHNNTALTNASRLDLGMTPLEHPTENAPSPYAVDDLKRYWNAKAMFDKLKPGEIAVRTREEGNGGLSEID